MGVWLEDKQDYCIIHLANPGTNKLDFKFLDNLKALVRQTGAMNKVKAVLIQSDLPFGFSSGLDLSSFFDPCNKKQFAKNVMKSTKKVFQINRQIVSSSKIYISSISGPVIGSAASITFACDFRIAAKNAWYWLPDVQFGGLLAEGGLDLLKHLIGTSNAKKIALANERIDVSTAYHVGLIQKIVELKNLDQESEVFCEKISKLSQLSLALSKKILNQDIRKFYHKRKLWYILNSNSTFDRMKHFIQK